MRVEGKMKDAEGVYLKMKELRMTHKCINVQIYNVLVEVNALRGLSRLRYPASSRSQTSPSSGRGCRQLGKLDVEVLRVSILNCPVRAPADINACTDYVVLKHEASLRPAWSVLPPILENQTKAALLVFSDSASSKHILFIVVFSLRRQGRE